MSDLLHPLTRLQLETFAKSPSHAIMLVGPAGIGKSNIAGELAQQLLNEPLETYPYKLILKPEGTKSIGIESVRQLEHFLSLRVPKQADVNRIVIIENAQLLTLEAQNALLKTLEEPPAGTTVILTAVNERALLPTILSRLRLINVKKPQKAAVLEHFKAYGHQTETINRAYDISGGLPGLMRALLEDSDHPLMAAVQCARQLLSQSAYERLITVDELAKQRELAVVVASVLQQMAEVSLRTATGANAHKWQRVLKAGYQAADDLSTNAQPKLVLTKLMLSL